MVSGSDNPGEAQDASWPDPADRATGGPAPSVWRCVALIEIANFNALRRDLGVIDTDGLIDGVAALARSELPLSACRAVGRTMVELAFDGEDLAWVQSVLRKLSSLLAQPLDVADRLVSIRSALGAATDRVGETDDVQLVEEAEEALAVARQGRGPVLRDLSGTLDGLQRSFLIRDLGPGIARGELFLQYQPKIHVRRQEVAGAEALVRWRHPRYGVILPGDFISAAERSSDIDALTLWVLERVIADQRTLAAAGHDITLFLNISGQLLANTAFVRRACEIVLTSGAKIGFEITETSVIRDPRSAIENLHKFAAIDIHLAIDDYGAGLSSLAYLKQLPARELKIDKMFVTRLTSSHRDPLIVRSTIDLAHALEMEVTAEGVETPAALALLSVMGCDMMQGYLLSRPVMFDALIRFLDEKPYLPMLDTREQTFARPPSFWQSR